MILYFWWCVTMEIHNENLDFYTSWEGGVEDIMHVQERADGSSDGLYEAMDIDLGNGYKECSNRNPDITQKWNLDDLFWAANEPTAEQLVEAFNLTKEELFPWKTELTLKESDEIYKRMYKKMKN